MTNEVTEHGTYIVADPKICHGQLTFRGTRIMVADVLEQVADGDTWGTIVSKWGGRVRREWIAEAVELAREALLAQTDHARPNRLVI
jgi:uncharacterized protein (DUF433 family)